MRKFKNGDKVIIIYKREYGDTGIVGEATERFSGGTCYLVQRYNDPIPNFYNEDYLVKYSPEKMLEVNLDYLSKIKEK